MVLARNFIRYRCKWLLPLLAAGYGWTCSAPETSSGGHAAHPTNAHEQHQLDLGEIVRPTQQVVISNQATVQPAFLRSATRIPVQGYITYDLRRHNKVAARVGGRIEKLYVRYQNQYIQKGDKIMELYSPELNTIQDEFLYLIRSGAEPSLQELSREKLGLLGLSRAQINRLAKKGEHAAAITIYSPYQGYITWAIAEGQDPMASKGVGLSAGAMGSMASGSSTPSYRNAPEEPIREGAYVNVGQTLFSVNDLNTVWAILSFETRFLPDVQVKGAVELQSEMLPERPLVSSVGFVEPVFRKEQKFTQARAYLPNQTHQLKINSLVSGFILPSPQPALVVPASSVYDVGRRKIVWVYKGKTPGGNKRFLAREIMTGIQQGDSIEIIRGLEPQEEIAREAGYLVDSESFIQPTFLQR